MMTSIQVYNDLKATWLLSQQQNPKSSQKKRKMLISFLEELNIPALTDELQQSPALLASIFELRGVFLYLCADISLPFVVRRTLCSILHSPKLFPEPVHSFYQAGLFDQMILSVLRFESIRDNTELEAILHSLLR